MNASVTLAFAVAKPAPLHRGLKHESQGQDLSDGTLQRVKVAKPAPLHRGLKLEVDLTVREEEDLPRVAKPAPLHRGLKPLRPH